MPAKFNCAIRGAWRRLHVTPWLAVIGITVAAVCSTAAAAPQGGQSNIVVAGRSGLGGHAWSYTPRAGKSPVVPAQVTGPIPVGVIGGVDRNYPQLATQADLAGSGYVEEEFFVEGLASRYSTPALAEGAVISSGHPYKSRLIVRKPDNPSRFNGVVVVEWVNVTSGYNLDALWQSSSGFFMRNGYAYVGVSASSRTRDWVGREKPAQYFQGFQGAHKALVYEHIPYGVVLEENATLATLQRFPIVMLPNVGIVSGKEVALLRRYVEEGGKLLVTGQSGLFDRLGQPLAESALSELIGANVKGSLESVDNWGTLSGSGPALSQLSADIRANWPFLVKGPAVVYEPTTAAPYGTFLKPPRTTRPA